MPAPRKPPHLRQNRITKDHHLRALAANRPPAPAPPAGLLKATRAGWESFWASDLTQLVTEADHPALERLFLLRDEWRRCLVVARRDRFVLGGATGQSMALHPAAKHVLSLEAQISKLEAQFGLTPSARLKLGVVFGEAQRSLTDLNAEAARDDEDEADDPRTALA